MGIENITEKDITIYRGNSYNPKIIIKNFEGTIDKIYFTVRDGLDKVVIAKNLENGITKVEDEYAYKLLLEADDTNNLRIGTYYYDIEIHIVNYVGTKVVGKFVLLEEQTRKEQER